jgi:hypothetical protein
MVLLRPKVGGKVPVKIAIMAPHVYTGLTVGV